MPISIHLKRTATILKPDQSRVLLRPFTPGDSQRVGGIVDRIMLLPEEQVGALVDGISAEFSQRHQDIRQVFLERFEEVHELLSADGKISEQRRLLIGSYFLAEYSLESAALFNPSIVPHPDQTGLPTGSFSVSAPPEKGTFLPLRFEPASSIPIGGSRCYPPPASSPSHARSPIPGTKRRCSRGNFPSWD
jgi:hypothetical protein